MRAFVDYYASGGLESASTLAYTRWQMQAAAGAKPEDIARLELLVSVALLVNTVPGSFWCVVELASRPRLLAEVRTEIRQNALDVEEAAGVCIVDLTRIRERCPLFSAVFQELLRTRTASPTLRMVYDELLLDGKYLLRKGGIVQVPVPMNHRREDIWGIDAGEFNPRRFMQGPDDTGRFADGSKAFFPFGMAPHVCPGRHFSTCEILATTAMLVMRFDICPEAAWAAPVKEMAAGVFLLPKGEFRVRLKSRSAFNGSKWAFRTTQGDDGKSVLLYG